MFINMEPRFVLNDFESFVSVQRMDLLRQKILEMPNNDTNAWKMHKPVAYSATEYCGLQGDIFENEENFAVEKSYSGDYSSAATIRNDVADLKLECFRSGRGVQYQPDQGYGSSMQSYQTQPETTNSYIRPSPVPRNLYSGMSISHGANNYTSLRNGQTYGQNYTTAVFTPSGMNIPAAVTSAGLPQSFMASDESSSWIPNSSFGSDRAGSSPAYANYSPATSSPNQPLLGLENLNIHNNDGLPANTISWSEGQDLYTAMYCNGGMSRSQAHHHIPHDGVRSGSANVVKWPSELMAEDTISPTALRINLSTTSLSNSESSRRITSGWPEYQNDETIKLPQAKSLVVDEVSRREQQRHRRLLPNSTPSSQRVAPLNTSREYVPDRSIRKSTRRSTHQERSKASPATSRIKVVEKMLHESETISRSPSASQSTEYNSSEATPSCWIPIDNSSAKANHKRNPQDDYLVRSKLAGMSYKDIKKHGKFTEAESTLRGRFRTLTKAKSARVRKPEWNESDDRLLKKAVRKLTPHGDRRKTPWKQIATYIADNGGSYHFGNATCRKRWDELQGQS